MPYAYRNGAVNLVYPQTFAAQGTATAERLAVEGDLLRWHPRNGTEHHLIVVASFEGGGSDTASTVTGLLGEYKVDCFTQDQIPELVRKVEREAC